MSEFATVVAFFEGAIVSLFCFMKADFMHMSIIVKLVEKLKRRKTLISNLSCLAAIPTHGKGFRSQP